MSKLQVVGGTPEPGCPFSWGIGFTQIPGGGSQPAFMQGACSREQCKAWKPVDVTQDAAPIMGCHFTDWRTRE